MTALALLSVGILINPFAISILRVSATPQQEQCYNETAALDDGPVGDSYPDVMEQCVTDSAAFLTTCTTDLSMTNTTAYEIACAAAGGIIVRLDSWFNCTSSETGTRQFMATNDIVCFGPSCQTDENSVNEYIQAYVKEMCQLEDMNHPATVADKTNLTVTPNIAAPNTTTNDTTSSVTNQTAANNLENVTAANNVTNVTAADKPDLDLDSSSSSRSWVFRSGLFVGLSCVFAMQ